MLGLDELNAVGALQFDTTEDIGVIACRYLSSDGTQTFEAGLLDGLPILNDPLNLYRSQVPGGETLSVINHDAYFVDSTLEVMFTGFAIGIVSEFSYSPADGVS
jgi:hypothetical protein